jgi:hypothetical protein
MRGRVGFAVVAVLLVALGATGCGGGHSQAGAFTAYPVQTVEVQGDTGRSCKGGPKQQQIAQRRLLNRDLRQLRSAAATVHGHNEDGNAALNKALDRFQLDVAQEAISAFARSRFIDLAAAIVAPKCYLCFQALEANRPVAAGAKLPCE